MTNPLIRDRDVQFLLYQVLDVLALTRLPYFADHDRTTFDLALDTAQKVAREVLYPLYRLMDEEPPVFVDGTVRVHPRMQAVYRQLADLGLTAATRPAEVGGQQLPLSVSALCTAYLMAANLSAYGFTGLTTGAAHLIEAFGNEELRRTYMQPMYEGRWTGTMALTEPQAGSSLADITTRATLAEDGSYRIAGSKIFISGGDQDLTENIVHLTLARIEGAPAGTKGVSLFCVPKLRIENGGLVDNDVRVAGVIHKIGWRGIPSVVLSYGDRADCHGWLVGTAHRGLNHMFQMMNEARIIIGMNGVATASVAYLESLAYARSRTQGRPTGVKDTATPPVPILQHADVRRMLLRQKSIVEGGLSLVARTALYSDLAEHSTNPAQREHARLLLDLLTPVAKSFPAEYGFESNALAVQIHGGYGYSSEYLPEAWLRDQKLNSLHEGTTGIQGLDLLGRKVVAAGGAAMSALRHEIEDTVQAARKSGLDDSLATALESGLADVEALTMHLASKGLVGDVDGMLLHSTDYLTLFGILIVGWQHLAMAAVAQAATPQDTEDAAFLQGKRLGAEYWLRTEFPRLHQLAELCRSGEDSYARIHPDQF